jgi:flagellar hook-length control protein FliK
VFEVAQTDLGRVNVRVAMAHDTVHAYLSTDRPDVGNALMNGQDRLQSALQASGLEMGQFRVHIDRQSAGSGGNGLHGSTAIDPRNNKDTIASRISSRISRLMLLGTIGNG